MNKQKRFLKDSVLEILDACNLKIKAISTKELILSVILEMIGMFYFWRIPQINIFDEKDLFIFVLKKTPIIEVIFTIVIVLLALYFFNLTVVKNTNTKKNRKKKNTGKSNKNFFYFIKKSILDGIREKDIVFNVINGFLLCIVGRLLYIMKIHIGFIFVLIVYSIVVGILPYLHRLMDLFNKDITKPSLSKENLRKYTSQLKTTIHTANFFILFSIMIFYLTKSSSFLFFNDPMNYDILYNYGWVGKVIMYFFKTLFFGMKITIVGSSIVIAAGTIGCLKNQFFAFKKV